MTKMTSKRSVLVLTFVLLFVGGIIARRALTHATEVKRPSYAFKTQATQYDDDGTVRPLYSETMYMSATGNWYSTKQLPNGKKVETFGTVGQGVFTRRNGEAQLNLLSAYDSPRPILTAEGFLKSPNFLRTEQVLGYPTFVTNGGDGSQFYNAPIIGGAFLKLVLRQGTSTVVVEPSSLVFGEPDPSLVKMPTGLPVSSDNFNNIHGQQAIR